MYEVLNFSLGDALPDDSPEEPTDPIREKNNNLYVRAVERVLPETLASELPPETVQFSSKLANIKSRENDDTLSELTDGTRFLAKMSFSEPKYTGHCAFRGLGFYLNGQPYAANINHIYEEVCVLAAKVVLVGDAWHPMTPNLGQGACCALEDLMILEGVS
ncbi:hypothetical protein GQ457_07G010820 [Hibiscus cannabinus]